MEIKLISAVSWTDLWKQKVAELQTNKKRPLRIAIVGIGHELRGDDSAGLAVAQRLRLFSRENFLVVEAGHAPENHTSPLRRFAPDLILLVDSAQLNEPPGTIRWLPWPETTGLSASTHTMPPYMLARYLTTILQCEVVLLGIQPANTTLDSPLSFPISEAVNEIVWGLKSTVVNEW
jgi:hydrogenase maturation protease HycI